ncbi:uroporphyrin-III C-methyltransferase [Bradyrhizobium sp. USDA 3262]
MSGFVSFVSAGPGDPELLTVKGAARLREADVVLYDDLASGAILDLARSGANLVAVGKRAGRLSAKQHHVSRLLVDYAAAGVRVVRLKSGDAGIFGRLEEEIEALRAAGIGYEIIPGVTSASVAAAQAGIPLTRRLTSRRVQFVTGADVTGELPADLNWGGAGRSGSDHRRLYGAADLPGIGRKADRARPRARHARAAGGIARPRRRAAASHHDRSAGRTAHACRRGHGGCRYPVRCAGAGTRLTRPC